MAVALAPQKHGPTSGGMGRWLVMEYMQKGEVFFWYPNDALF